MISPLHFAAWLSPHLGIARGADDLFWLDPTLELARSGYINLEGTNGPRICDIRTQLTEKGRQGLRHWHASKGGHFWSATLAVRTLIDVTDVDIGTPTGRMAEFRWRWRPLNPTASEFGYGTDIHHGRASIRLLDGDWRLETITMVVAK